MIDKLECEYSNNIGENDTWALVVNTNSPQNKIEIVKAKREGLIFDKSDFLTPNTHSQITKIDKVFNKYQSLNFLYFNAFKNFMKDVELAESADQIEE